MEAWEIASYEDPRVENPWLEKQVRDEEEYEPELYMDEEI